MSSFKKKTVTTKSTRPHLPVGCKPSIYNNQVVVSSGVASIDFLLGGGLPLGSLVLIEEDELRTYSDLLLRYFISEGILCRHPTIVCTSVVECEGFLTQLPGVETESIRDMAGQGQTGSDGGDPMKIAFRYEALQQVNSEFTSAIKFCHSFDLTHKLDYDTFVKENPNIITLNKNSLPIYPLENSSVRDCKNNQYSQLIQSIRDKLSDISSKANDGVIRIALQHVGSMLWTDSGTEGSKQFLEFLFKVRALTRSFPVTFVLTYPTYNHAEVDLHRIRHIGDVVYRLECFQSSEREVSKLFSDYHGLFHLVKLPKLNSLQSFIPDTLNFGFKAKKKRFVIEKLHLPPELGLDESNTTNSSESQHKGAKIDKKTLEF